MVTFSMKNWKNFKKKLGKNGQFFEAGPWQLCFPLFQTPQYQISELKLAPSSRNSQFQCFFCSTWLFFLPCFLPLFSSILFFSCFVWNWKNKSRYFIERERERVRETADIPRYLHFPTQQRDNTHPSFSSSSSSFRHSLSLHLFLFFFIIFVTIFNSYPIFSTDNPQKSLFFILKPTFQL